MVSLINCFYNGIVSGSEEEKEIAQHRISNTRSPVLILFSPEILTLRCHNFFLIIHVV